MAASPLEVVTKTLTYHRLDAAYATTTGRPKWRAVCVCGWDDLQPRKDQEQILTQHREPQARAIVAALHSEGILG